MSQKFGSFQGTGNTKYLNYNGSVTSGDIWFDHSNSAIKIYNGTSWDEVGSAFVGIDDNATSTAITIDASENVGINSTTPSSIGFGTGATKLFVSAPNSNFGSAISAVADSAGRGLQIATQAKTTTAGIDLTSSVSTFYSTTELGLYASGAERMRIDSSGRVGIGTTSPLNQLVISEGTGQHGIEFAAGTTSYIQAYDRAISDYGDLKIDAQIIQFGTDNGAERMRIDSSGNVGIGTDSPAGNSLTINKASVARLRLAESGVRSWDIEATSGSWRVNNATNSIEAMRIDSSGNVGIGTSSPSTKLHISGGDPSIRLTPSSTNDARIDFTDNTGTVRWYTGFDESSGNYVVAADEGGFGSSNIVVVDDSGKVGIGTSSPARQLSIEKNGTALASLVNTAGGSCQLLFGDSVSDTQGRVLYDNNGDYLTLYANGSERMRINSSGNVGIGVTDPELPLDIKSNAGGNALNIRMRNADDYAFVRFNAAAGGSGLANIGVQKIAASTANMMFYTAAGGGSVERMRIDSNGNVGIGTTTPNSAGLGANGKTLQLGVRTFIATDSGGDTRLGGLSGSNFTAFYQGGTERARIDSSGNLLVGQTSTEGRLTVRSADSTSATNALAMFNSSGTGMFYIRGDGAINTGGAANSPYFNTTASAANLNVSAAGFLARSTSSARYKENIRDYDQPVSIDALRPVFFNSKNEDDDKTYAGLIAEEVHDAGFTEFVEYNDDGEPDAVFYANMVALCIKEIQDLKAEVTALKGA